MTSSARSIVGNSLLYLTLFAFGFVPSLLYAASLSSILSGVMADRYSVVVDGDAGLKPRLLEILNSEAKSNLALQAVSEPSRRAVLENRLLARYLRAMGYYAANVNHRVSGEKIHFDVVTGPVYRIDQVLLSQPTSLSLNEDTLQVKVGDNLTAEKILNERQRLRALILSEHCLYDVEVGYDVTVAHETQSARVVFSVAKSPQATFGEVHINGLNRLKGAYVRALIDLNAEACFKRSAVDRTRIDLIQSNLFSRVTVNTVLNDNNVVDVHYDVQERKHRTMSAGIGYTTEQGAGISAGWEHRNLLGAGQRFKLDTLYADHVQRFSVSLGIPLLRRDKDRLLTLYADQINRQTELFESEAGKLGLRVDQTWLNKIKLDFGAELRVSEVIEDDEKSEFALISLPLGAEYDRRSDPLNPKSGWVVAGRARPYWDANNTADTFLKMTIAASTYYTFDKLWARPTLALKGASGTINGGTREDVPADLRFYAGGGGSVRGYPFQSVGVLSDGEPEGGLSFNEVAIETRFQTKENWGLVFFLDGGMAYRDVRPSDDEELFWGSGVGLRFYSSFAPFRFDVAVPMNKREEIDEDYQIYVSIGQAF